MQTLKEQQAKAWSLAPDDAELIQQFQTGSWFYQKADSDAWAKLCDGQINGWDWRDTLQSREEWEAMNDSYDEEDLYDRVARMRQENPLGEWKDGLPPVGEVCEILWNGVWVEALIKFLGSNIVVFDLNGEEESSYYTTENHCCPFRPIKSEADKPEQFIVQTWAGGAPKGGWSKEPAGVKITHIPSGLCATSDTERSQHANRNKAMTELLQKLEKWTEPDLTKADKLRDVQIRLLAKAVNTHLCENNDDVNGMSSTLYGMGCRMTRELTTEVREKLRTQFILEAISEDPDAFIDLVAAYVRGELKL